MNASDKSGFDEATRVLAGDDGSNYDNVAITLHWLTAILVVTQFALAETWDYFSHATQESMQSVHVSVGILLAAVVIARIVWRFIPGHQMSSLDVGWMKLASKGAHYLLYLLLVAQAATGFLFRWAQGHPLSFFGLFAIPGPFGAMDRATRHQLHGLHTNIGWAIIIVAGLHAAAALYHYYFLKDRVLQRMLPAAR